MRKEKVIDNINPLFLLGIAHRGYHDENFTENGLKAFKKALDNNLAIELDVHVTKDLKLIVCHDSELKRTTGKSGIIEDLTLEEIKDKYLLLDGEKVPTLSEVFNLIKEQVPIVVELKVYNKNYKILANVLKKELRTIHNKKNIFLISFDPRALFPFRGSGFMRGLLVCKEKQWTFMLRHFFESLDLDKDLLCEEKYRKYAKKHFVNCWTIENEDALQKVYSYSDTVTFQLFDHRIVNGLLKK